MKPKKPGASGGVQPFDTIKKSRASPAGRRKAASDFAITVGDGFIKERATVPPTLEHESRADRTRATSHGMLDTKNDAEHGRTSRYPQNTSSAFRSTYSNRGKACEVEDNSFPSKQEMNCTRNAQEIRSSKASHGWTTLNGFFDNYGFRKVDDMMKPARGRRRISSSNSTPDRRLPQSSPNSRLQTNARSATTGIADASSSSDELSRDEYRSRQRGPQRNNFKVLGPSKDRGTERRRRQRTPSEGLIDLPLFPGDADKIHTSGDGKKTLFKQGIRRVSDSSNDSIIPTSSPTNLDGFTANENLHPRSNGHGPQRSNSPCVDTQRHDLSELDLDDSAIFAESNVKAYAHRRKPSPMQGLKKYLRVAEVDSDVVPEKPSFARQLRILKPRLPLESTENDDATKVSVKETKHRRPVFVQQAGANDIYSTKEVAEQRIPINSIETSGRFFRHMGPAMSVYSQGQNGTLLLVEEDKRRHPQVACSLSNVNYAVASKSGTKLLLIESATPEAVKAWAYIDFPQQRALENFLNMLNTCANAERLDLRDAELEGYRSSIKNTSEWKRTMRTLNRLASSAASSRQRTGKAIDVTNQPVHRPRLRSRMQDEDGKDQSSTATQLLATAKPAEPLQRTRRSTRNSERTKLVIDQDPASTGIEQLATGPSIGTVERLNIQMQEVDLGPRWKDALCVPPTGRDRATVEYDDLYRLEPDTFYNDNLIAVGIKFIERKYPRDDTYIFNTFFYDNVKKKNWQNITRWTAKIDIFKYRYVVVPINEDLHWYLAIICNVDKIDLVSQDDIVELSNPDQSHLTTALNDEENSRGRRSHRRRSRNIEESLQRRSPITEDEDSDEVMRSGKLRAKEKADDRQAKALRPHIITLDSMGHRHPVVTRNLKDYLEWEANTRKKSTISIQPSGKTAQGIPQQANLSDCGVYLIGYMTKFMSDPAGVTAGIIAPATDEQEQWANLEPLRMRAKLRKSILAEFRKQRGLETVKDSDSDSDPDNEGYKRNRSKRNLAKSTKLLLDSPGQTHGNLDGQIALTDKSSVSDIALTADVQQPSLLPVKMTQGHLGQEPLLVPHVVEEDLLTANGDSETTLDSSNSVSAMPSGLDALLPGVADAADQDHNIDLLQNSQVRSNYVTLPEASFEAEMAQLKIGRSPSVPVPRSQYILPKKKRSVEPATEFPKSKRRKVVDLEQDPDFGTSQPDSFAHVRHIGGNLSMT